PRASTQQAISRAQIAWCFSSTRIVLNELHIDANGNAKPLASIRGQGKLSPVKIKLTVAEVAALRGLVDSPKGRGGFQNLLLYLLSQLDYDTGEIQMSALMLDRINRYAFSYGNAYWRKTLRRIFRRTLGTNLDRGFIFR